MIPSFTKISFLLFVFICFQHGGYGQNWSGLDQNISGQVSLANGTGVRMALDPQGVPHVVYLDIPGHRATVKKFNGTSWELVGEANFTAANSNFTSLAIDAAGTPFVVYKDGAQANKASVKKFDGSNWVDVGNPGFSAGEIWANQIALDAQGNPVVAFQEGADRRQATVMKYNGTSWVSVGTPGITAGGYFEIGLALEANGTPVVAFTDGANGNKIVVKKFVGNSWVEVGTGGVSAGEARYPSIALDARGAPFVAFQDRTNGSLTRVRTFNGSSWVDVGGEAAYFGAGVYASIKLDAAGNPTVAFSVESNYKAIVRKYANGAWITVGPAGFSTGHAYAIDLVLDANGLPIVGFEHYTGGVAGKATVMRYVAPPLSITTQPQASTIQAGQQASFTVAASETGISYQWQVSQDGGASFSNIINGPIYSGATTAHLTLANAPLSMNGYLYRVQVSSATVVMSEAAALTITTAGVPVFDNSRTWQLVGSSGNRYYSAGVQVLALDSNGLPYVAMSDYMHGSKVTVARFDGTNWVTVGDAAFSARQVYFISLVLDAANTPYVAYQDEANGGKATVMKFNGTSWVSVGPAGISAGAASNPTLAFDASGSLYVAYTDGTINNKSVVKKFTGSSWVNVGSAGFSTGEAWQHSLALDTNGNPYVVYNDGTNNYMATVKKFTGSGWVNVGTAGFVAGEFGSFSIKLDAYNTPYVVYEDGSNGRKATVKKFASGSWVDVGTAGFSAGPAQYTSMSLDASGTPYVAYQDIANGNKATVKRYNGNAWADVGTAGFSAGEASPISLALAADGTPFVAYRHIAAGLQTTVMKFASMSIRTAALGASSYCASTPLSIAFMADGLFAAGNTFTAQLSDATGSFAAPTNIGSGSASPIAAAIPANTLAGTGYRIRVLSAFPAVAGTDNGFDIEVKNLPVAPGPISGNQLICPGESISTYALSPVPGASAYGWAVPGDWHILSGQGTTTLTVVPGSSGEITVTAGNTCGQSAATTLAVVVRQTLSDNNIAADQTICSGSVAGLVSGSLPTGGDGTFTYLWESSTAGVATGFGPAPGVNDGQDYRPTAALTATTWLRRKVLVAGCTAPGQYSNTIKITVLEPPATPTALPASLCGAGPVTLSATGAETTGSYRWYTTPAGGTPIPNATGATFTTPFLSSTTTYYVSAVNGYGCESYRQALPVTIHALPAVDAGVAMSLCSNEPAITLSGFSPAGGSWLGPGVTLAGVFTPAVAGPGTHVLTYSYTDANGCMASASRDITVAACAYFKEDRSVSRLVLSPNPTPGKFRIELLVQATHNLTYRVYSRDGKLVLEKSFSQVAGDFSHVLDMEGYAKGFYLLQQITDTGVVTKPFVLQ